MRLHVILSSQKKTEDTKQEETEKERKKKKRLHILSRLHTSTHNANKDRNNYFRHAY
eukprot:m.211701 g.211701  ORF g.211701 m.211701 type:complete len:57 (-) comp16942_c1_seq1:611-781(-)